MHSDDLFSEGMAAEIFSDKLPTSPTPTNNRIGYCQFCDRLKLGTRDYCLQVTLQSYDGVALTKRWVNYAMRCCGACYWKGVTLNFTGIVAVIWCLFCAIAGPLCLFFTPWPWAMRVPVVLIGVVLPFHLIGRYKRWRLKKLLGPELDARLRRSSGVRNWSVFDLVCFLPKVPKGEPSTSLDAV